MQFLSMFFLCFTLIFLSELGDKTQILVLSFSTKNKTKNVLLGIAIGTFFSHGLAILFGSKISEFATPTVSYFLFSLEFLGLFLKIILRILCLAIRKVFYKKFFL